MTESVLRGLGATPKEIDRERERIRADLFGGQPPPGTVEPVGGWPAEGQAAVTTGPRRAVVGEGVGQAGEPSS
jgi:hypothetical protein